MATSKYARVAEDIRARVRSGDLKSGDRLPTIKEMIAQYEVGYGTLNMAIRLLEAEGLIEGRQGDGIYVR